LIKYYSVFLETAATRNIFYNQLYSWRVIITKLCSYCIL